MTTSTANPGTPASRLAHSIVGLGVLIVFLVAGVVGAAHGARWMGLTHFGGIIHGAEIQLTSWDPSTPGIKVVSRVEPSRGNARYKTAGVMAWVRVAGQEKPLATYQSQAGRISGGGERWTIGLWPKSVAADAGIRLAGANSVLVHVEEVEMRENGELIPIKTLGDFVVPVAR